MMMSDRAPKQRNGPRRTRGRVQPPTVPQSADYWEELFQRCLHEHEQKRRDTAMREDVDPDKARNRSLY
jgi:hypothetical protein